MSNAAERYVLAPMREAHLDEVLRIERMCHSNPWPRHVFEKELEAPTLSRPRVALTRRGGAKVVGYCIGWVVADQLQIHNVAVHPDHRRRGLAVFMIEDTLEIGIGRGAESAFLEVRRSNRPARRLYESLGFREAGERKDYYNHPSEDAVVFRKTLAREPLET